MTIFFAERKESVEYVPVDSDDRVKKDAWIKNKLLGKFSLWKIYAILTHSLLNNLMIILQ